jgi:hypothetical protein
MDMQQIVEMLSKMRERMDADREERKTEMQTNQAKAKANMKTHMLEVIERQIGSLAANMEADKEERKEEVKAVQEKVDVNQARMEEITAKIEERLKGEMRLTVSAMEDKMEAIVHSILSERDGKIQRRIENVMERQEIPKEEAAVHTMRAWQEETAASLECKEQGPKELETEVERREVPTEEAAVKSSGIYYYYYLFAAIGFAPGGSSHTLVQKKS